MKDKKQNTKFPATLYVWLEEDGKESYPIPETDLSEISQLDGTKIGVYCLEQVGTLKKTIVLE